MTDSQPQRVYLVRHGEAKAKDEDPERGLTESGRMQVRHMAAWAATATGEMRAGQIQHSGKLRAQQTAEIFAEYLGARAHAAAGLAPNDDPAAVAATIESRQDNLMVVGHLPQLERLAALLLAGNAEAHVVLLEAGALLELARTDSGWQAACLMQPRLLPSAHH